MTQIMKNYCAKDSFFFLRSNINSFAFECFYRHIHQMQCTQAMLKPAVDCPRVNEACKPELPDVAEPLEPGMLNDIKDEIARNVYKSVDRIIDYLSLVGDKCHF